jgi:hypothetical protein
VYRGESEPPAYGDANVQYIIQPPPITLPSFAPAPPPLPPPPNVNVPAPMSIGMLDADGKPVEAVQSDPAVEADSKLPAPPSTPVNEKPAPALGPLPAAPFATLFGKWGASWPVPATALMLRAVPLPPPVAPVFRAKRVQGTVNGSSGANADRFDGLLYRHPSTGIWTLEGSLFVKIASFESPLVTWLMKQPAFLQVQLVNDRDMQGMVCYGEERIEFRGFKVRTSSTPCASEFASDAIRLIYLLSTGGSSDRFQCP